MADDPMEGAPPADGVVVAPGADAAATVTDATQQQQAREARETVGRLPRQRSTYQEPKKPQPAAARESTVEENPYERYLAGPQDSGPDTLERMRLNTVNSYYRGSAAGALGLSSMAKIYGEEDPRDIDPEMKKARDGVRAKYEEIVSDLMAYDLMPTWSGLPQLGAAIGGTVAGALPSPESFLGWAAKGATWTARTMWAGIQQGLISGATDPVIQMLNIDAGVQKEYEPWQTVGAVGFGAVLGSGFHAAGEGLTHIIDQRALRQQLYDISRTDNDLISAEFGIWAQDPRNGIYGERGDLVKPERKIPPPEEYDARVSSAKEDVWADKSEMGNVKRGLPRNENHAVQIAKERVMIEDVPEAPKLAADLSGASPDQIREIAQFYRPEKGLTPIEAFEKAVDRWTEIQEAAAIRTFDQEDYGLFISPADRDFDTLKAEGGKDSVLADMYQRLDDYYTGGKVDHDAIPFETGTPARAGGEASITEAGRREVATPGAEPREGGEPLGRTTSPGRAAGEGLSGERVVEITERIERTDQGDQVLIPGVEPITDADRAKAGAAKPMRGGDAPAGGLFDINARAQRDLLDAQALMPSREGGLMPGEVRRDADVGIATPEDFSPGQASSLKSLQQQAVALADAVGVPLRTGRVSVPGALGIYKNRSGVVRVKELADFEVVKHEIGHAIEAKLGKPLTDLIQKNTFELGQLDYDKGKMRPEEGFAEWMRIRMENPKAAEMQAPTFSNAFDALLITKRPDLYQLLTDTAVAHRAWLEAPSVDVAAAVVRDTLPASFREEVREATKEGLPVAVNTILQKGYQKLVDRYAPMERAVRDLARLKQEQQGGGLVDIKAAYDPSVLIRSLRRVGQTAHVETMFGVIPYRQVEPQGASLKDVLNDALGKPFFGRWNEGAIRDFDRYLAVRMSEYLWRRYDEGLIPNAPSPIKPGDARQAMADLEKAYPTFRNAADKLQDFVANVRKKKYDAGLWSKDLFDKVSEYEFYVPMKRKFEEGERGGAGAADGSRLGSAVSKRKGSERDIVSPIRNIMLDVLHMEQDIRMNEIRKSLGQLAESVPGEGGRYAERLQGMEARKYIAPLEEMILTRAKEIGMDPGEARGMIDTLLDGEDGPLMGGFFKMEQAAARGEPIVFTWEGGKPVAWRVMAEQAGDQHRLYELMTETPPAILDLWTNFISVGAGLLRGGITNSPTFILTNYIKDQLQVALTRPGYVPFLSGIPGIISEVTEGTTSRMRAQYAGVMGGSLVGEVERKFEANIKAMGKQGYLVKRTGSVREFLELAQLTEAGTRNSVFGKVYKQKLREGLSPYEAGWEAAHQADDIMDFSRNGDRMDLVRRLVPFLNANIQGQDRYTFRQLIEPFLKKAGMQGGMVTKRDREDLSRAAYAWTMAGAGGLAFGAAWAGINWEKESYRDASPEVKGTHVLIPGTDGTTYVMPKPFELGIGFTAGEYAYAAWVEKDPRAAAQFAEAVRQSMSPPDPVRNTPFVTPAIELMTNYSFFRKGPIVPDAVRNPANPELEYTERTTSGARILGDALGWSPIKIDYAMGAVFGTNGRDLMSITSMADKDTPTQSLDDTMFIRRFVKNDERISGRAKQFWELMGAKNGKYANDAEGYRKLVKEAVTRGQEPVLAKELLDKLPAPERVYVVMKEGANNQGKPAFTADERRLHPLVRAQEAVSVLSGIARDLQTNTLIPYREKERLMLSPDQRRHLIDEIQTMAGAEQRNAFAVVGEPGYVGRQVFDVNDYMTVIEKLSPNVAEEIATRYATAKVYDARAVQEAWPTIRDEIMTYGTDANIKGVGARARGAGTQFSGIKAKKPGVLRVPIGAAPAQPNP